MPRKKLYEQNSDSFSDVCVQGEQAGGEPLVMNFSPEAASAFAKLLLTHARRMAKYSGDDMPGVDVYCSPLDQVTIVSSRGNPVAEDEALANKRKKSAKAGR